MDDTTSQRLRALAYPGRSDEDLLALAEPYIDQAIILDLLGQPDGVLRAELYMRGCIRQAVQAAEREAETDAC